MLLFLLTSLLAFQTSAQPFDQLKKLEGYRVKIYCSAANEQTAISIAARLDKAYVYNSKLLDFSPDVTVLILSAADWRTYTKFAVYGMPHYSNEKILIVAAEDNAFWKSFVPPLDQLPKGLGERIKQTYRQPDSSLSMQAFFDLLAIHELGHAFHMQAGLTMQRKWMGELFVNILLHTYIAENEPAKLPALTIFPEMVVAKGTEGFIYTSLPDIEEKYEEITRQHPNNYGWYQSRWHSSAANIYTSGGKQVLKKLWDALKNQKVKLTDEELILFLDRSVDKTVADVMRNWNQK